MRKRNQEKHLWSKDFSCITLATILSAIGQEAMNLPISLLVFEETQSTLLSALVLICGMLPDVAFSVLAAPLIDRGGKKKWIVGLDLLLALLYAGMGILVAGGEFHYGLYLVFTLAAGTISVIYRLAYQAWYPTLIPAGFEQKGYAVSSTIYPLVIIVMAPAAAFLYQHVTMSHMFWLVGALTLLSVGIEAWIHEQQAESGEPYSLRQYRRDLQEGFAYLKRENGIRNIYTYMSITSGASEGIQVLTQAYYQTQPWLSVTMLGFLKSAEMIGRVLGGLLQYVWQIPVKKRYAFTKFVYLFYDTMDTLLLFCPYPLMVINRFLCGGLGVSSATVRESAVQSYLPSQMRARVNAFLDMAFAVGGAAFHLLAGLLGQVMSYRAATALLGLAAFISAWMLIVRPAEANRPVYEAVREISLDKQ